MKHISILVPTGAILGSIEGPRQVLTEMNKFLAANGRPHFCKVQLLGFANTVPACGGRYTVFTDALVADVKQTDLIIIPALDGDMGQAVEENKAFIPWILKQHQRGAEVASLCYGAFLLGATGLINGKKCATHWMAAQDFRRMYPEVDLVTEKVITDEQGIYSSGGAFSYLNLILYLVEKYAGRDIAVFCAKAFQIDMGRDSQSPFTIFQGQKTHEDEPIKEIQQFIEQQYRERLTLPELATKFAIGKRDLQRRFKKATSNSVLEYIQRVKIEAAKMSLESSRENVA